MNKKIIGFILVSLLIVVGFQNCGEFASEYSASSSESVLGPAEPLALSSDVTSLDFKLNSNDEMILPEENMDVSVDLESKRLETNTSSGKNLLNLTKEEVQEIRILLRLIRKIKLSEPDCKKRLSNLKPSTVMDSDEMNPEKIVVNTRSEKNIVLGKYLNCQAQYDISRAERRVLKRIILRIILSRLSMSCPDENLFDQPICNDGTLIKKLDRNFCVQGYKCIPTKPVCKNETLISPPACPKGSDLVKVIENGCIVGYRCESSPHICPLLPQIAIRCAPGYTAVQNYDENKCVTGMSCQLNGQCPVFIRSPHDVEEKKKCEANNGKYVEVKNEAGCTMAYKCEKPTNCPVNVRPIYDSAADKSCKNLGGKYIEVKNNMGCIVSYRCERPCPDFAPPHPDFEKNCLESGGQIVSSNMVLGCPRPPRCENPSGTNCPLPFIPPYSEVEAKKCIASGGEYTPARDENKCIINYNCNRKICPAFSLDPNFKSRCEASGGKLVYPELVSGCPLPPRCEESAMCPIQPIPSERMLTRCKLVGGKVVVKEDQNSCPVGYVCEGGAEPCPEISPSLELLNSCRTDGGQLVGIKNSNGCTIGFKCDRQITCPPIASPLCVGSKIKYMTDENGCGYEKCVPIIEEPIQCPAILKVMPVCPQGAKAIQKFNKMGCVSGYECEQINCPQILSLPPRCEHGTLPVIRDGCVVGYQCQPPVACPQILPVSDDLCTDEQVLAPKLDKYGCTTGFDCKDKITLCIDDVPPEPKCTLGAAYFNKNKNGCFAGWTCKIGIVAPDQCPILAQVVPECSSGKTLRQVKDKNNCTVGYSCN